MTQPVDRGSLITQVTWERDREQQAQARLKLAQIMARGEQVVLGDGALWSRERLLWSAACSSENLAVRQTACQELTHGLPQDGMVNVGLCFFKTRAEIEVLSQGPRPQINATDWMRRESCSSLVGRLALCENFPLPKGVKEKLYRELAEQMLPDERVGLPDGSVKTKEEIAVLGRFN